MYHNYVLNFKLMQLCEGHDRKWLEYLRSIKMFAVHSDIKVHTGNSSSLRKRLDSFIIIIPFYFCI